MEGEAQVSESTPSTPEAVTSSPETQQESVSHETQQTENTEAKPAGFDPVEFTPAQLERFNRVYGNMKRYEGKFKEQEQANHILADQLRQVMDGQQQIVSHLQVSDFQEAEGRLAADRDAAWTKGDVNAFNAANDKLHEIKTQRLLAAQQQKNQPKPQVQQQRGVDGERIVNGALDKGSLDSAEANIARSWMAETDQSGSLKRPWTQQTDPRNYSAALEAQAVFNSPLYADKSMVDKLREVDRRMGIQTQQQGGQSVLPAGNLTRPSKTNNIKLSPEIEKLAIRTKFGGPKAKSDQDHIEAWKRAVTKSQSKGATR